MMPSHTSLESPDNVEETPAVDLDSIAGQDDLQTTDLWKLSDVSMGKAKSIRERWDTVPVHERRRLVARLVELAEATVEANFNRVFRIALQDEDPEVRGLAIAGLWEDQDRELATIYADLLADDGDIDVRASAAAALRPHAQRMIDDGADTGDLTELLLNVADQVDSPTLVRRRCIETAGVMGHDPRVQDLIRTSFADDDQTIVAGAVRAMGLSHDPVWLETLEREMDSDDAELRFEAAGAAGLLGDTRLVPGLSTLVLDADPEIRTAAVASLGQIGGPPALRVLRNLLEDDDLEDLDAVEAAITEAELLEDPLADLNSAAMLNT